VVSWGVVTDADGRLLRILGLLRGVGGDDDGNETRRLCVVAAEITGTTGAGIMIGGASGPHGSLCSTDERSALIEDLQFTLGEGPGVDAHRFGRASIEPDLADSALVRWAAFVPAAVAAGVRAVCSFPVRVGVVRLGALDLYRDRPGPLSDSQRADAFVLADMAARAILALRADPAPTGPAVAPDAEADFHLVVHQAAGMVSVQLAVSVPEALVRLRAHAFAVGKPINDVAAAVVGRDLRFGSERPD
jgi:hypothetical protein